MAIHIGGNGFTTVTKQISGLGELAGAAAPPNAAAS